MLLFYSRPAVLDKDRHRGLRLLREDPSFAFARETNSVPLVGAEFAQCVPFYPIVFAGSAPEARMPMALLGVRDRQNLFVDSEGSWGADYIPAYIRRYPFVLAETTDAGDGQFNVCFDETYDGIGEGGTGQPLFSDDGEPAPFLQRVLDFLRDYQSQAEATRRFMDRLGEIDLLVERHLEVRRPSGDHLVLNDFYVVDEERLQALDDRQVLDLHRSGMLALITAHLLSLTRVNALAARSEVDADPSATDPRTTDKQPAENDNATEN